MTAADPAQLAGVKLGNYRLGRILGRGNMGVVYLATDEALLRPTAVKVLAWSPAELDPETWFLAEARSVARLNHPSVVQIAGGAVLTSWDAWAAPDDRGALAPGLTGLPVRPPVWPTPSVHALINAARAADGTPPRPDVISV